MTGRILHECVVWCGGCGEWARDASTENKQVAGVSFRDSGWKLTRALGWLCPVCAPKQKKPAEATSTPADECSHNNAAPYDDSPQHAYCPDCRSSMMTADLPVKQRHKSRQQGGPT